MTTNAELSEVLGGITTELRSLVEINKMQTERILENNRILNSLFTRQLALEKAVQATLNPIQRDSFNMVFEESLQH